MKVYTKKGDTGTTGLLGGVRVSKGHLRIDAYGTVDELNSHIGLLRDQKELTARVDELLAIQNNLFVMGSTLATAPQKPNVKIPSLSDEEVNSLEKWMDAMDAELPAMKHFVLPGGHQVVSFCHIARCVCRRAERLVVVLAESEAVDALVIKYLNRLSDYLFVLSRWIAHTLKVVETSWIPSP